jgi:hypothetical protein
LLLVLISLSLVSPVLASAAKPDAPACCLRNGKHLCEMGAEVSTGGKPGLRADCPYRTQGSLIAATDQKPLAAPRSVIRTVSLPVTALESLPELLFHPRPTATHGTRGPPSRFA